MAYIDCIVDTNPMAQEIKSVSGHINGTTAAVVGMRAAVIKAEEDAANRVCDDVNKGFYTLIHSQISQKIAKLHSNVDSHLMKLNQLRKQLNAIRGRMERDYGMISQRYLKLFNNLNKNLQQQVYELDKPTINFAVRDVNMFTNRSKLLTATVPVSQVESLSMSQKIVASNMKFSGMRVIDSMTKFLGYIKEQEVLSQQILLSEEADADEITILVPVVICEYSFDKFENKQIEITVNDTDLTKRAGDNIKNVVSNKIKDLEWQCKDIPHDIESEFSKYLSASTSSERVKNMAALLFKSSNCETI